MDGRRTLPSATPHRSAPPPSGSRRRTTTTCHARACTRAPPPPPHASNPRMGGLRRRPFVEAHQRRRDQQTQATGKPTERSLRTGACTGPSHTYVHAETAATQHVHTPRRYSSRNFLAYMRPTCSIIEPPRAPTNGTRDAFLRRTAGAPLPGPEE